MICMETLISMFLMKTSTFGVQFELDVSVNAQRLQKSAQRGDVLLRHTWKSKCISCPQMDQLICPQMDLLKTFFSVWQHVTLPYISCLRASQNVTNGQSRGPVYIYMLRRVEITWFGFILSVSFCRTLFTKSKTQKKNSYFVPVGKSKFAQWAIKVSVAHLHDATNTMNLIWSDSEQ